MNELVRAAQVETISSLVVSPSTVAEVFFSLRFASRRRDIELLREPIPRALRP